MNTTVDIYEKYKKPIDELTKINPELGNFYKLEFLKKEAKRRGFFDGAKYISPFGKYKRTVVYPLILTDDGKGLKCSNNAMLAYEGKWAEIIKEKILSKSEAEAKLTELSKDGFEYKIEF